MTIVQNSVDSFKTTFQGSGVVDSNGTCTIYFSSPNKGTYYTGSIIIYDSPPGAVWMKLLNGVVVDTVIGQSTCANIQLTGNEQIRFVCSGLKGYIGQTFHATFFCVVSPEFDTNLIIPAHDSFPQVQAYVRTVFAGNIVNPGRTIQVDLQPSDRSLLIAIASGSGPATITVTGNSPNATPPGSGAAYLVSYVLFSGQSIQIPAYGAIDPVVNVQFTGVTGNALVTIAAKPDDAQIGSVTQPVNVIDQNGPTTNVILQLAAGPTSGTLLAAPPTGSINRIFSLFAHAATTVFNAALFLRIQTGAGIFLIGNYTQANGVILSWVGNMPINDSLVLNNNTSVASNGYCCYRNEAV